MKKNKKTKKTKRNSADRYVYSITPKPKHYVEVKDPPRTEAEKRARPQDARQMQYNRRSKRYKIYSGSYLPKDRLRLLKKGWVLDRDGVTENNSSDIPLFFRRKSTNQWVRHDNDKIPWHWYNCWKEKLETERFRRNKHADAYYDKYGNVCGRKDKKHHIEGQE